MCCIVLSFVFVLDMFQNKPTYILLYNNELSAVSNGALFIQRSIKCASPNILTEITLALVLFNIDLSNFVLLLYLLTSLKMICVSCQ